MATDPQYRHVSTAKLARLAMRLGRAFAAPATWCRLAKQLRWHRPRRRLYPTPPRTGIRARRPDEYWHMDVTVIRLLDGTRVYLHAVIDNFSRRILAWRMATELGATHTAQLLRDAAASAATHLLGTSLVSDSGAENVNRHVDDVLAATGITQVDVIFSNSLIERWWMSLRHSWLYLQTLDSLATVESHVAFFVQQHNDVLPHSAFHGQTPTEMYRGTGSQVPARIAAARANARTARLEANRAASCHVCPLTPR